MRLRATLIGLVAAVLLAGSDASRTTAATHPCDRDGETVVKNRFVRVYHDEDLFACSYESGRTASVGYVSSSSSGFFDSFGFVLGGRFVAYVRVECSGFSDSPCETNELRVLDMGRFKQTMRHPLSRGEGTGSVIVKSNGSIAYLVATSDRGGNKPGVVLHRRDRRGRLILASGTGDTAPRDLRLVGSTLHWFEGDRERTKTLQ